MLFDLFKDINKGVEEYRQASNAVLIDVRETDEFQEGYIPGAVNVPLSELEEMEKTLQAGGRGASGASAADSQGAADASAADSQGAADVPAIPKDAVVFVYCLRGSRANSAAAILKKFGYQNVKNIGGIAAYKGKVEKPEK